MNPQRRTRHYILILQNYVKQRILKQNNTKGHKTIIIEQIITENSTTNNEG